MLLTLMDQLSNVVMNNLLNAIPAHSHALWQGVLSREEGSRSMKSVSFQHMYKRS